MMTQALRYRDGERGASSFLAQSDCFAEHVGRHNDSDDNNLDGIAIDAGGGLQSVARTSEDPIGDLVVREPIHEELLCSKWLDKIFVPSHCNAPALVGAKCAREELEHNACCSSSKFDSAPHYYGVRAVSFRELATGARS